MVEQDMIESYCNEIAVTMNKAQSLESQIRNRWRKAAAVGANTQLHHRTKVTN